MCDLTTNGLGLQPLNTDHTQFHHFLSASKYFQHSKVNLTSSSCVSMKIDPCELPFRIEINYCMSHLYCDSEPVFGGAHLQRE